MIEYCNREEITFTRGRAYKKNDQCYVEQKNGEVVRQLVGYDRFEGLHAYKQLSELYRAVRLYVNFFQPSMKLKKKCRISSKLIRTYFPAKTPFQRLKMSDSAGSDTIKKLDSIYHALDPVRLLKQIEFLQDALWRHAILRKRIESPEVIDIKDKCSLEFKISACSLAKNAPEEINEDSLILPPEIRKKRQYRKTKKTREKRWWRTRKDPFAYVWDEVCKWLEDNPERSAISILLELQEKYPGNYSNGQLRTLQRRVQTWRENAIITFDDKWLKENTEINTIEIGKLNAVVIEHSNEKEECHLTV